MGNDTNKFNPKKIIKDNYPERVNDSEDYRLHLFYGYEVEEIIKNVIHKLGHIPSDFSK